MNKNTQISVLCVIFCTLFLLLLLKLCMEYLFSGQCRIQYPVHCFQSFAYATSQRPFFLHFSPIYTNHPSSQLKTSTSVSVIIKALHQAACCRYSNSLVFTVPLCLNSGPYVVAGFTWYYMAAGAGIFILLIIVFSFIYCFKGEHFHISLGLFHIEMFSYSLLKFL